MSAPNEHVYKKLEMVGSSPESIEKAVDNALAAATKMGEKNMRWAEVGEIRCHIDDGKVKHWQVGVKIGCTLPPADKK